MDEWFSFEANNNAEKLRKVMIEHPTLPVVFECASGNYYSSFYTDDMEIVVGEVFNSKEYGDEYVITDRDDLEDRLYDIYKYGDVSSLDYDYGGLTADEWVSRKMAESEKYWIPCIIVSVD